MRQSTTRGAATTTLNVSDGFIAGRVGSGGPGVPDVTTTLARLLERHQWTGVTLICDIEGLETDLVEHEGEIIERHCRTLVIEVHPEFRADEARARMFEALQWRGFRPVESLRKVHVSRADSRNRVERSQSIAFASRNAFMDRDYASIHRCQRACAAVQRKSGNAGILTTNVARAALKVDAKLTVKRVDGGGSDWSMQTHHQPFVSAKRKGGIQRHRPVASTSLRPRVDAA